MNKETWIRGSEKLHIAIYPSKDIYSELDDSMKLSMMRYQMSQQGWRKIEDIVKSNKLDMVLTQK